MTSNYADIARIALDNLRELATREASQASAMRELLCEIRDALDDRADTVDGDPPRPNWAMSLVTQIDEVLGGGRDV